MGESELFVFTDRFEVPEVAGIGQGIKYDDPLPGVLAKPVMNKIRTDKSGAAGDEDSSGFVCIFLGHRRD
jgi:hypothetical protein